MHSKMLNRLTGFNKANRIETAAANKPKAEC